MPVQEVIPEETAEEESSAPQSDDKGWINNDTCECTHSKTLTVKYLLVSYWITFNHNKGHL